jgi:diguanylate cyclase (GGDEF)-like protein/PAS domain S-box-containing protein
MRWSTVAASSLMNIAFEWALRLHAWMFTRQPTPADNAPIPLRMYLVLWASAALLAIAVAKCRQARKQLAMQQEGTQQLAAREKRTLAMLDNGNDGTMLLTPNAEIIYASPGAQRLYGTRDESLIGQSALTFIHSGDLARTTQTLETLANQPDGTSTTMEVRSRRADGVWHWTECTCRNLVAEPAVGAIVTTWHDIDTYKKCEESLTELAVTDGLTGLANYRRHMEVLTAEIRRYYRTGRSFAIIMLDLDGLKRINDRYGHLVGSRALCRIGDILRTSCRSIDTPARYGGDEFVVVLPDANLEVARNVVERITARLQAEDEIPTLSVSAGIATCPEDGETAETLLQQADLELYKMKSVFNSLQAVQ